MGSMARHFNLFGGGRFVSVMLMLLLILLVWLLAYSPFREQPSHRLSLFASAVLSLPTTFLVLLLTGLWQHHNQLLHIPAVLALISLAPVLENALNRKPLTAILVMGLTAVLMSGPPMPKRYARAWLNSANAVAALRDPSPETKKLLTLAASGTYARLGRNDDAGHAIGLDSWHLQCPRFHQYDFQPEAVLEPVFKCVSTADYLLIGTDFSKEDAPNSDPYWDKFVSEAEQLLASHYDCDAPSGLRACKRRK